jgi:hypothetical protein
MKGLKQAGVQYMYIWKSHNENHWYNYHIVTKRFFKRCYLDFLFSYKNNLGTKEILGSGSGWYIWTIIYSLETFTPNIWSTVHQFLVTENKFCWV